MSVIIDRSNPTNKRDVTHVMTYTLGRKQYYLAPASSGKKIKVKESGSLALHCQIP